MHVCVKCIPEAGSGCVAACAHDSSQTQVAELRVCVFMCECVCVFLSIRQAYVKDFAEFGKFALFVKRIFIRIWGSMYTDKLT